MEYRFCLPDLGEGITEGEITAWLIEVGQDVREDEPMVEVETDKATVEIACPVDGLVLAVHATPGERVAVGSPLVTFEEEDGEGTTARCTRDLAGTASSPSSSEAVVAEPATGAPASREGGPARVQATPAARRLARELGIELDSIAGTGPAGTITDRDVRAVASDGQGTLAGELSLAAGVVRSPEATADHAPEPAGDRAPAPGAERREPLRGVRRRIAERLVLSQQIPKVTVVEECDFTELAARRREVSYTPFVVKATVSALQGFPELNATLEGEEIVYHNRYDIGIATQGPSGLMVPVLRGADSKSLTEIDEQVARLASEVRAATIAPEDLRGGTFTLTLAGRLGGLFATPLVNPGEAAILGVHRIAARPVVKEDKIVVAQIGLVSCSFDHRITDGTRATMFLLHVIEELQRA
ncbi:MAG: 2-oxo acid dehydrogenase subunit E2 [Actinomycetota bacterium]|nr:2-oxo acid dehydrogenase subunit E2 [Actinomycetota bacterium]